MPLTIEEREAFLAEPHIGALSVASGRPDRAPLALPIWYGYEPGGEVWITTDRASRKFALIQAAGRFSMMADYGTRYVSVEGEVVHTGRTTEAELRAMAARYLPEGQVDWYVHHAAEIFPEPVTLRMRPRRWLSADLTMPTGD
ncbi:pyridoxamine 5-phosphate oxidase [Streptosporangium nondiastaticum]|uniref:Pyridoxamine 5-phosphate oxidase n=1 Tax=Streptosporangium nondiastaticum TaxID=35764 RepID=A0A9X7PFJ9_9ACTN|nr:pyridoxamine 5'-phosphate oxidase family protein [Streptosporangium nondiastaticum]PSJ25931.1 pyridoxamine 5-phosphate oxidase [Streptosporangium nondiastaticum]